MDLRFSLKKLKSFLFSDFSIWHNRSCESIIQEIISVIYFKNEDPATFLFYNQKKVNYLLDLVFVLESENFILLNSDIIRSTPLFILIYDDLIHISDDINEFKNKKLCSNKVSSFILSCYSFANKSIFEGVRAVQAGEIVLINKSNGKIESRRHFVFSPSNTAIKISEQSFVESFKKLKEQGRVFEYKEVTGITHQQLQEEYQECDVFIDQIIAGWYGTASIEAMSYGKPTIAFINPKYFENIDYGNEIPIINETKDNVYYKIKAVLEMNRDELNEIGIKSQDFVFKYHSPKSVIKKLISIYNEVY